MVPEMQVVRTQPCVVCNRVTTLTVPLVSYRLWQDGELIQRVWPESTAEQRELLMTGTHSKCFDALVGDDLAY